MLILTTLQCVSIYVKNVTLIHIMACPAAQTNHILWCVSNEVKNVTLILRYILRLAPLLRPLYDKWTDYEKKMKRFFKTYFSIFSQSNIGAYPAYAFDS